MARARALIAALLFAVLTACGASAPEPPAITGNGGDVVETDPSTTKVDPSLADREAASTRRITYVSHDGIYDSSHHVTASIYVPKAPPPPDGYPIVAVGRSIPGTGPDCMSSALTGADVPTVIRMLRAGYVVVVPDYQGFGRPQDKARDYHPFMDSTTAAENMVDAVHATHNVVPNSSIRWVAVGVDQGGQAAWAANELSGTYGFGVLKGSVSISPTVNISALIDAAVTGTLTSPQKLAYIAYVDGLSKEYPGDFNLADYRRGIVAEKWDRLLGCEVDKAVERQSIIAKATADDLRPANDTALAILRGYAAKINLPQGPAKAPMLVAFGSADPLIPFAWAQRAVHQACGMGDVIAVKENPSGAVVVDPAEMTSWIAGRFADQPATNNCAEITSLPPAPTPAVLRPAGPSRATPVEDPGTSLITGWLPTTIQVVAFVAVLGATGWRSRQWRLKRLPVAVVVGLVVMVCAYGYVGYQGWGHDSPWTMWMWLAITGFALGVVALGWPRAPWWRRVLSVLAVLLCVVSAASVLNASLGYLPTVRTAWERVSGDQPADWIEQSKLAAMVAGHARPTTGTIVSIKTPDAQSGFAHRNELVYLPPAWFASSPPPKLPAIMMIGAELSHPGDWLRAGEAARILDDFAAKHGGAAPVVVFPDSTGAFSNDTECVNGSRGNAADHLTKEVVPYVVSVFGVSADAANWGLVGWSTGGTCALTLSVSHPELFSAFVDLDGTLGPNAGNKEQTIARLFGGDAKAWAAFDPKTIVEARGRYPGLSAWLGISKPTPTVYRAASAGPPRNDQIPDWDITSEDYASTANQLCLLLSTHGSECSVTSYVGEHSFPAAARGMADALPWLAGRIGTPGVPRISLPGAPGDK